MTDAELWALVRRVGATGEAWPALAAALDPVLEGFARRQPIGRLRDRDDTPREIVTRALARLHARDFATIAKLCAMEPPPELRAWLRVIVRRSAIDYMRESPEFERGTPTRPARWISLASLSPATPAIGPSSLDDKRGELLAYVRDMVERGAAAAGDDDLAARLALAWRVERIHVRRLVKTGARYLDVLAAVLGGQSYAEIGARLAISRREVELTIRHLEELLSARGFAAEPT